uniref:Si:dkey-103g5.3 n=1 Tax=Takifugu rubripes TaxID=31033 RepID=H2UJM1_TAKRU
ESHTCVVLGISRWPNSIKATFWENLRGTHSDNSDLTVDCGTTVITLEVNLCSAKWAGFNASDLALNSNHNISECLGSVDISVDPPVVRYQLPVNHSQDNSCRQSLQVREAPDPAGPFSSFLTIQSVIITGYIDTPRSDQGIISYSTDLHYHFSCRYPLEYLINNTQIVASSVSVATSDSNGTFIDTLKMAVFNDTNYSYQLVVPSSGLELRSRVYVEVKAVNLTGNFYILLDHCFATPTAYNMSQTEQHNFFTGCSVEQRTSVTSNGLSTVARFDFEAFRFIQHRDQPKSSIYMHCILRLCEPNKCQELLSVSLKKRLVFGHDVIWEITGNERRDPSDDLNINSAALSFQACGNRRRRALTPFGRQSTDSATLSLGPLYMANEG